MPINDQSTETSTDEDANSKPRRSRRKTSAADAAVNPASEQNSPADAAPASETPPGEAANPEGGEPQEEKKGWVSNLPEPFGRQGINIGDGRHIRLLRSNRWQQAQIMFLAPEGEDPKPDVKYTRWLREHGWQWRSQDKAWTKQFEKNSDDNRYARSNSDLAHQKEYIELANLIRQDKGLEPVAELSEQRAIGG